MAFSTGSLVDIGVGTEAGLSLEAVARGRNASCTVRKEAAMVRRSLHSQACAEPRYFKDSEMRMKNGLPLRWLIQRAINPTSFVKKKSRIRVCPSVLTRANHVSPKRSPGLV